MKVAATNKFFEDLKNIMHPSLGSKLREAWYWVRMHTKKRFLKVLKATLKSYPYDSSFMLDIEKAKILEMADYLEANDRFVGVEFAVRDLRICAKLIDIFNGDETKLYHHNGDIEFVKSDVKGEDGEDTYEMKPTDDFEYVCDVNVNMKNIDRFIINEHEKEYFTKYPHELYKRKARYLYHKIRLEKEELWWD